jgi:hypothetical protein
MEVHADSVGVNFHLGLLQALDWKEPFEVSKCLFKLLGVRLESSVFVHRSMFETLRTLR